MISGNFVHLSEELLERCRNLGEERVEAYKHKNSTELSMLGIEHNPVAQGQSIFNAANVGRLALDNYF